MSSGPRFYPGQVVGQGRFRVLGLIGRGAMGEVYRADDMQMGFGERVALKFLPQARERDRGWLARFKQEIRIARRVSHPNVCRVHDIGEHEGTLFLSMEFIEGEDLFRLIRRFGRDREGNPRPPLPLYKALELSRQLCAGLGAIHDCGILHRDIKPSNVIVDERGLAKITDFGLARWAGRVLHADEGTVPYMAPEQLANREVSERSDLYSLGLVLYELFTGQRAFDDESREGLIPLSALGPSLDPRLIRAITRCLEPDPADRPGSARELAGQLPRGKTPESEPVPFPPPEVLLGRRPTGSLRPKEAWPYLSVLLAGLVLVALLGGRTHLPRFLDPEAPPQVLASKAREAARELGYPGGAEYRAYGFAYEPERLRILDRLDVSGRRQRELGAEELSPVSYWYRESPSPLVPFARNHFRSYRDPPAEAPGSLGMHLSPRGTLRRLDAVPPAPSPSGADAEAGWVAVQRSAGFEAMELQLAQPSLPPSRFAGRRAAWTGVLEEVEGVPVRLEAAAQGPAVVSVRTQLPGGASQHEGWQAFSRVARSSSRGLLGLGFTAILILAVWQAWRNLRRRHADHDAARRIAVYAVACRMAVWLFGTHHGLGREELETLWSHLAEAVFFGGFAWVLYMALEPPLRRDWRRPIASWVRLVHGRFRDPRVGRDLLLGSTIGVVMMLAAQLCVLVPAWLQGGVPDPHDLMVIPLVRQGLVELQLYALRGLPSAVAVAIYSHAAALVVAFVGIFGYFQIRILVRRQWVSVVIALVLMWLRMLDPSSGLTLPKVVAAAVLCALWLTVLLRVGFLPAVLAVSIAAALGSIPLTPDLAGWYAPSVWIVGALIGAVGAYGFFVALDGRPPLRNLDAAQKAADGG